MLYKSLVILHILGASIWIGAHAALAFVVLPQSRPRNDLDRIVAFQKGIGRLGLVALIVQLVTGLWLADRWIGGWSGVFFNPTPAGHLVLTKIALLVVTVGVAGYTHHRVAPRLETLGLRRFTILTWATTILAVLLLVAGVGIRTGGLF